MQTFWNNLLGLPLAVPIIDTILALVAIYWGIAQGVERDKATASIQIAKKEIWDLRKLIADLSQFPYEDGRNVWKPIPLDQIPKETIDKVVVALENKEYDWRTIEGIIRETKLSFNDVFGALTKLNSDGQLVQARNPDENGHDLFTTRKYYNKSRSIIDKIKSSWADGPV